jgi:hypothetical protein
MISRIIYEDWQLIFPVIALLVASTVYIVAAWRATTMDAAQVERMAQMPLEKE